MGGTQPKLLSKRSKKEMRGKKTEPSVAGRQRFRSLLLLLLAIAPFNSVRSSDVSAIIDDDDDDDEAKNSSLVVGLSFRNDAILPPHPWAKVAAAATEPLESTVLVTTCHFVPSTTNDTTIVLPTPSQCCATMMLAAKAAQEKKELPDSWVALLSEMTQPSFLSRCKAEGSRVPLIQPSPSSDNNNDGTVNTKNTPKKVPRFFS